MKGEKVNYNLIEKVIGWSLLLLSALTTFNFFKELGISGMWLLFVTAILQLSCFVAEHRLIERNVNVVTVSFAIIDAVVIVGGCWVYLERLTHTSVFVMLVDIFSISQSNVNGVINVIAVIVGIGISFLPDYFINKK